MRRIPLAALAAVILALASHADDAASRRTWRFEADKLDAPPAGFRFGRTGSDAPGRWIVRAEKGAPSRNMVDQACGLVFRYRDENNYYFTRAGALEDNVRLYFVKDGPRKEFASWSGKGSSGAWHELAAQARGDHFEIFWDGAKVIDARDGTFAEAGKVGVWTKADSVTLFDDLTDAGV